ncbi:hypothetical protein [Vibrio phage MZH0603]|nr:hypothetical protein [Vibrio phage MZH0603]
MPRYYYVIKCTQRGVEVDLETESRHRDYHTAEDIKKSLNSDFDKPSYVDYYVSQYENGVG